MFLLSSGTKSTLDDLFESLRQLEEDPAGVTKKEGKTDLYDWRKSLVNHYLPKRIEIFLVVLR